jgi:hypothetical protein
MGKQNRDPYVGQVGLHGLYVAGYVSISQRDQERKYDCGKCACSFKPHEVQVMSAATAKIVHMILCT